MSPVDKMTDKAANKAVEKIAVKAEVTKTKAQRIKRKLTPEQVKKALEKGKAKGLPDGWKVELNNDNKKIWISPDGTKKCLTIPLALAWSVQKGLIADDKMPTKYNESRVLTQAEVDADLKKAKEKGLPAGWTVEWNSKRHQRNWISPDGNRKCHDLRQALAYSIKTGLVSLDKIPVTKNKPIHGRSLTEGEVTTAMKQAKEKGLPDGKLLKERACLVDNLLQLTRCTVWFLYDVSRLESRVERKRKSQSLGLARRQS
jgi:hypothetical protein